MIILRENLHRSYFLLTDTAHRLVVLGSPVPAAYWVGHVNPWGMRFPASEGLKAPTAEW